ncbi:MAG TPA: DUF805 domain-containing protein [Rhizomicrobium sp.]|jgi:uncharacterized membrane protein YhaH (DUF805 family)|nr:DUF805 domain-containing protein [Rhizomicrobium sp.]
MSWSHYLFGFHGRINRARYWQAIPVGFGFLVVACLLAVPYIAIDQPHANSGHPLSPLGIATIVAECALALSYFVFAFALMVKRLHDRNRSAWFILPFFVVPELLSAMVNLNKHAGMPLPLELALRLAILGLSIWAFVELGCLRGTEGENRYGPDPLQGAL